MDATIKQARLAVESARLAIEKIADLQESEAKLACPVYQARHGVERAIAALDAYDRAERDDHGGVDPFSPWCGELGRRRRQAIAEAIALATWTQQLVRLALRGGTMIEI